MNKIIQTDMFCSIFMFLCILLSFARPQRATWIVKFRLLSTKTSFSNITQLYTQIFEDRSNSRMPCMILFILQLRVCNHNSVLLFWISKLSCCCINLDISLRCIVNTEALSFLGKLMRASWWEGWYEITLLIRGWCYIRKALKYIFRKFVIKLETIAVKSD